MSDEFRTVETALPEQLDERVIARKYGLRELILPDSEQIKVLTTFLSDSIASGRCGPVPSTAATIALEYLQGTVNRQQLTKGPGMKPQEYELLQAPYYAAARVISRLARERQESMKGQLYQKTWLSLNHLIETLRNLLDPGCFWMRTGELPVPIRESLEGLRDFLVIHSEHQRRSRDE